MHIGNMTLSTTCITHASIAYECEYIHLFTYRELEGSGVTECFENSSMFLTRLLLFALFVMFHT